MSIFFHKASKAALCTLKVMMEDNHSYYCPGGLFNVSGYPKKKKLSKRIIKDYQLTIKNTKKLV